MTGNENSDTRARLARSRPAVDINLNKTLTDCYHTIEKYIINEWQVQYDVDPVSLHYHMVQPVVRRRCKSPADENRYMEKALTRLRLDICLLNSFKSKIRVHPTGLCDSCQVEEDVYHYLIQCKD